MSPSKPHLFIALSIPDAIKEKLHEGCVQIQSNVTFKKWVYPADYHITLKFLGGVDNDAAVRLKPIIDQIASKMTSFSLALEGLNYFGKKGSPRILWMNVKGELEPLFMMQKNTDASLASLGFIPEARPYQPHLTLAKNYTGRTTFNNEDMDKASQLLPQTLHWEVSEIVLYQTHLGREPMYETVEVFAFNK